MSYTCKLNGTQTDYPCSQECPLFGDCVAEYCKYLKAQRKKMDNGKPENTIERNDKGAWVCSKCKTDVVVRLDVNQNGSRFEFEPYCAHCGARLIEEDKK